MWRRKQRREEYRDVQGAIPALPSIYEHLRSHLAPDRLTLMKTGMKLPDEDYQKARMGGKPDSIGFAPGAVDGILRGAPISRDEANENALSLHRALLQFARRPTSGSEANMVRLMVNSHAATSLSRARSTSTSTAVRSPGEPASILRSDASPLPKLRPPRGCQICIGDDGQFSQGARS